MIRCRKCNNAIARYPCRYCGEDGGEAFLGKEGTSGGGD